MRLIIVAVLVWLATCAQACSVPTVGQLVPGAENPKAPFVVLHMDTDFTPSERANAQKAADIWHRQTGGLAIIVLDWDLDFSSISNLAEQQLSLHHLVVRAESGMRIVQDADDDSCPPDNVITPWDEHQCTLGWMTSGGIHNPFHRPIHGAFVVDRIADSNLQLLVMLHEFGHALGLPHVDAVQAIMYPSAIRTKTACLRQADLQAFCQVNDCGSTKMVPCE